MVSDCAGADGDGPNFFERADMLDTKVGTQEKDDPAQVAKDGFEAMLAGAGDVVSGWQNRLQTTLANVTPAGLLAEQHRKLAEPGTAEEEQGGKERSAGAGRSKD